MSEQQSVGVSKEKLQEYDQPVLFSACASTQVWHVPEVVGQSARFHCGIGGSSYRVTSLSLFQRRRNVKMCEHCQQKLETDDYPDNAPFGDSA